jgi:hypothetical protein
MKTRYLVCIIVITAAFGFLSWNVITFPSGKYPWLNDIIQAAAVSVALIAAIIALASSDPVLKSVKVDIQASISGKKTRYKKADLPKNIVEQYADLPENISSSQIHFVMVNNSGFTLNNPTLTFRLPNECQHPHKEGNTWVTRNNSNIYNSQKELRRLEFGDTTILSNSNLPYWNNGETITIWIRMLIERIQVSPFEVVISVNCLNAQGCTKKVLISSKLPIIEG